MIVEKYKKLGYVAYDTASGHFFRGWTRMEVICKALNFIARTLGYRSSEMVQQASMAYLNRSLGNMYLEQLAKTSHPMFKQKNVA